MKYIVFISVITLFGFAIACTLNSGISDPMSKNLVKDPRATLKQELEEMRKELKIPGMSVAVAKEDTILWSSSFGWADKEHHVPVTDSSIFHLASLTKPYATTVILQLAQEGKIDLDSYVSEYGINLKNSGSAKIRHLLSHTSSGEPGTVFKYDGNRFAELQKVVEQVTGNSFAKELDERILRPLNLMQTMPNPLDSVAFQEAGGDMAVIKKYFVTEYARKWGRALWPSGLFGPLSPIDSPKYFGTAAGLVATATDVARFSLALDGRSLINDSLYNMALTRVMSPSDQFFPYGTGWFIENYKGNLIAWQYGHWFGSSSLIIKVPKEKITFVILANSDGLSRSTGIGDKATILASPVASIVLESLVSQDFFVQ